MRDSWRCSLLPELLTTQKHDPFLQQAFQGPREVQCYTRSMEGLLSGIRANSLFFFPTRTRPAYPLRCRGNRDANP